MPVFLGISRSLALFLLVVSLYSFATACTYSQQCDDGDDATFDLCVSPRGLCLNLNLASRQGTSENAVLRSPFYFIDETNKKPLSVREKRKIIAAAIKVLEGINPHRFLQLNYLDVDIVKELKAFSKKRAALSGQTNLEFHMKMQSIFQLMDDKHSQYHAPYPLNASIASTFFTIKQYFESTETGRKSPRPRYVVSSSQTVGKDGVFGLGSEVLKYGGKPIQKAVKELGRASYGSNKAAQISTAVVLLTSRSLLVDPFPVDLVVEIGFRNKDGSFGAVTVPWNFLELTDSAMSDVSRRFLSTESTASHTSSAIPEISISDKQLLPDSIQVAEGKKRTSIKVKGKFRSLFAAEKVATKSGTFGLLTLPSFGSDVTPALVAELSRILRRMPKKGLVIDLRNNDGGKVDFVKLLAELVSDKSVPPQLSRIRATRLMSAFLRAADLKKEPEDIQRFLPLWRPAVRKALQAKKPFIYPAANIYSEAVSNRRKQVYKGPVITLVDGLTYSAGDIFTALQEDEKMSLVVGTSGNVGAGGASTMTYSSFTKISAKLFPRLPRGVDFSTAFSRVFRTGRKEGAVLENFGVQPDVRYYPTYNDAVDDDSDLLKFLGKKLKKLRAKARAQKLRAKARAQ